MRQETNIDANKTQLAYKQINEIKAILNKKLFAFEKVTLIKELLENK